MSGAMLISLYNAGLLPNYTFQSVNLGEDHLFSLFAKAAGFTLATLSEGNLPFGCAWKGLPTSPQQLIEDDKKIIHSVRYWEGMTESDIRAFFKEQRQPVLHKITSS